MCVKKALESDLPRSGGSSFSPDSRSISHDVSKPPRFLSNFPDRAVEPMALRVGGPGNLDQRARYAEKTSTGFLRNRNRLSLAGIDQTPYLLDLYDDLIPIIHIDRWLTKGPHPMRCSR